MWNLAKAGAVLVAAVAAYLAASRLLRGSAVGKVQEPAAEPPVPAFDPTDPEFCRKYPQHAFCDPNFYI